MTWKAVLHTPPARRPTADLKELGTLVLAGGYAGGSEQGASGTSEDIGGSGFGDTTEDDRVRLSPRQRKDSPNEESEAALCRLRSASGWTQTWTCRAEGEREREGGKDGGRAISNTSQHILCITSV